MLSTEGIEGANRVDDAEQLVLEVARLVEELLVEVVEEVGEGARSELLGRGTAVDGLLAEGLS